MNSDDGSISRHAGSATEVIDPRAELARRVITSSTFEKSPKLRSFLQYVCQCALHNEPEAATEQQIGIHVFGRNPGYNPNEDNIVRSQARLLRLKLEHHFANEGKAEPVIITIPKGRYLPAFPKRTEEGPEQEEIASIPNAVQPARKYLMIGLVALAAVVVLASVWLLSTFFRSKSSPAASIPADVSNVRQKGRMVPQASGRYPTAAVDGEIRIAAGSTAPFTDVWGRVWNSDQYYQGGVARPGPQDLFPFPPNPGILKNIREGTSTDDVAMRGQSGFRYDIPVPAGVYELRLYFADPVRRTALEGQQDAQNVRHFSVDVNGRRILSNFDAVADAGLNSFDVRVFRDIAPAADGKVHIEFIPGPERPFVNALELTAGTPGKLKPIRISAHSSGLLDRDGTGWSADNYYINGRTGFSSSEGALNIPELYSNERYGNFSYSIPVPPGSYTVRLHFMETFFGSNQSNGLCQGAGCRVFDVSCNDSVLLKNFDIFQAAGAGFRPVVRVFHNLHPNGQGKLLLSFTSRINYAEVRAIEVIDEGH